MKIKTKIETKIRTKIRITIMGGTGTMDVQLGHEKLHVYHRALSFVAWKESLLAGIDRRAAVLDHLDRASESIVECIANGNSRHSRSDRNRYFDVAVGSGLECAACLDVCACKQLVAGESQAEGKRQLQHVVRMTIGLRAARTPSVREDAGSYATGQDGQPGTYFPHEGLNVYQVGLELIRWVDVFLRRTEVAPRYATGLDKATTSFVLNIAEGNGRFSRTDQRRFLDIAHTCAMNAASGLDLLVAKACVSSEQVTEGKRILARLVPLILGLRGYLEQSEPEG
jgi:four helix bundle protein